MELEIQVAHAGIAKEDDEAHFVSGTVGNTIRDAVREELHLVQDIGDEDDSSLEINLGA